MTSLDAPVLRFAGRPRRPIGVFRTSPIVDDDQELYSGFFRAERPAEYYGNSWSYLTQACRGLGYGRKYFDGDRLFSYGRHGGHYVIVRPVGRDIAPALRDFAHYLHRCSRLPVYLKHVALSDAAFLMGNGKFFDMMTYPWCPEAAGDDLTFPEIVVPIAEIMSGALHTPVYNKFRMSLNRFNNEPGGATELIVKKCPPWPDGPWQAMARTVVYQWSAQAGKGTEAYANMLAAPSRRALRYLVLMHGEPVAFYVFERIGERAAGCYANLSLHTRRRGLAETALCRVFEHLFQHEGIDVVNLGGSEMYSLHKFKKKFGAERPSGTASLVFEPPS